MASFCRRFAALSLQISHNLGFHAHRSAAQIVATSGLSQLRCISTTPACPMAALTKSKKDEEASPVQKKLMQFFDDEENWGKDTVKTGRPWKTDELRLKSNSDLHKLWYVLLKERNMLLTMEEEYKRNHENLPNPERIYKVEESMENVVTVLQERNAAVQELEHGEASPDVKPRKVWHINVIGKGYMKVATEHRVPKAIHGEYCRQKRLHGRWVEKYLRLLREKQLGKRALLTYKTAKWKRSMRQKFPDDDFDD